MKQRDRVQAALEHERPDRPYTDEWGVRW